MAEPDVFSALADPTRRKLVGWLAEEGSGTATGFADRLPMSRQAVARHLQELRRAQIVESSRLGRETRFTLRPKTLTEAASWLDARAAAWDRTLARLSDLVAPSPRT